MKKIEVNDFLKFKFLGNLQTSPNNQKAAWIESSPHYEDNDYHRELYLLDKGNIQQIRKLKTNQDYIFLDDSTLLIDYQKNVQERNDLKEQSKKSFYLYHLDKKELDKAFTLSIPGKLEKIINQSHILLSAQLTVDDHILYEGDLSIREKYIKDRKKLSLYEDIDEIPYYFNGSGFKTGKIKQLFIYNHKNNELKRILDKSFSVETYLLTRNKKYIFYTGKYAEKVMTHTSKIYKYDIEKDKHEVIYDDTKYHIDQLVETNRLMVIAKDMLTYGQNQNPDFYELVDGEMKLLRKYGWTYGNSVGSDCRFLSSKKDFVKDNDYYFVSTVDDHNEIFKLSPLGEMEVYFQMNGSIDGMMILDKEILIIGTKEQGLQEIYRLTNEKELIKLSSFNDKVFENKYVAVPEEVILKKENHEVKGFVLLPEGYNPNHQYPLILDIHGGPKTVYGKVYYHEMQYWVNQGYVVAFANPRGSDGKGDAFADIRGKYGTIDYEDLMGFVDLVLLRYTNINQSQLYVTGGSYGGFMTNWIVGHTNRFKAAVTQRSISNWISFYGTSDIGYYFASDQTDGHPIMDLDKLYEQSPIKNVMKVETPLLFIHADKDYRCPIEQAQQFYAILKIRGIDTKLIWFKDENHELSREGKPQARIKRIHDITDWFRSH